MDRHRRFALSVGLLAVLGLAATGNDLRFVSHRSGYAKATPNAPTPIDRPLDEPEFATTNQEPTIPPPAGVPAPAPAVAPQEPPPAPVSVPTPIFQEPERERTVVEPRAIAPPISGDDWFAPVRQRREPSAIQTPSAAPWFPGSAEGCEGCGSSECTACDQHNSPISRSRGAARKVEESPGWIARFRSFREEARARRAERSVGRNKRGWFRFLDGDTQPQHQSYQPCENQCCQQPQSYVRVRPRQTQIAEVRSRPSAQANRPGRTDRARELITPKEDGFFHETYAQNADQFDFDFDFSDPFAEEPAIEPVNKRPTRRTESPAVVIDNDNLYNGAMKAQASFRRASARSTQSHGYSGTTVQPVVRRTTERIERARPVTQLLPGGDFGVWQGR